MDKKFKELEKENARINPGTHLVQFVRKGKNKAGYDVKDVRVVRNRVRKLHSVC